MGGGKSLSGLGSIPALLERNVVPDPRGQAPEHGLFDFTSEFPM